MRNERLNRSPTILFAIGILLNCLFFTHIVLDHTLVPRFVFLSFLVLAFTIFILIFNRKFKLSIDIFIFPYLIFTIFSVASISWTLNTSIAIIESSKLILYFFVFLFSCGLLVYADSYFLSIIFKIITLLFFISVIKVLFQLSELTEVSRPFLYRITGISGHKNLYSSFIFLCSIFSILGFFYLKKYWKYIALSALILQMVIVVILQTRAVWIAYFILLFSGVVLFFLHKILKSISYKQIITGISISIVLINIFFLYTFPKVINFYNEHRPASYHIEKVTDLGTISERVLVWEKTYELFFSHPWLGVGPNNWQIYFPGTSLPQIYPVQDLNVTFQRPHNDFLWILSEYGIVGFNLYLMFIVSILAFLFYNVINHFSIFYMILISGLLGYLCISFFDFPKERIEHNLLFAILLSISIHLIKKETPAIDIKLFEIPRIFMVPFILLFLMIGYTSFLNFKGEYFTKKMYVERLRKDNPKVINFCNAALSYGYSIDPTSVPICWYRGNANANLGNFPQALTDFKLSFKAHPFNHYVLNDLGSSFFMNHQIDSAKFYYKEAARINPRFDDPRLNLTAIYITEGNYKEAQKWNESISHDSERRNYYRSILKDAN